MDPALAARLADIPPGPVTKLTRDSLLTIADALAIQGIVKAGAGKTTVDKLKELIKAVLASPDFLYKDQFQKFLVYNRSHGVTHKTSADKAEQDKLQEKSNENEPSGAHKKLLVGQFKTDPNPQYKKLGVAGQKQEGVEKQQKDLSDSDDESESDLSSLDSSGAPKPKPEKKQKRVRKSTANNTDGDIVDSPGKDSPASETDRLPIIVKFTGSKTREVWVTPEDRADSANTVTKTEDTTGAGSSKAYFTSLKKLLPLAIAKESPIKNDARGKIGIVGATGGHLNLGTVEQFMTGPLPSVLNLSIDRYQLQEIPSGLLCDVFYDPTPANTETKHTGALPSQPESKPLEVARARVTSRQAAKDAEEETPFIAFLRIINDGPKLRRPTARTVGEMLDRYLQVERVVKHLKETWSDGGDSFRVPSDDDDPELAPFKGVRFGIKEVLQSLRVGSTTHNNDSLLFRPSRVEDDGTRCAADWVEKSDDEKLRKKFGGMKISEWIEYLDRKKAEKEQEEREKAKALQKKRKREQKEKEQEEKEQGRVRKNKKSKGDKSIKHRHSESERPVAGPSGKARASSNNIDSDD